MILKKLNSVILFQLDQTSKMAKQYSQREFDSLGIEITVDQWVLLKVIEENAGLSQSELAEMSFRDPASITRTLDLLDKKGLIVRKPIANNRRQYSVELTKVGDYFIAQNSELVADLRERALKGFSKKEVEEFSNFLNRVQKNFR
jgi:DNA-binding MarR family transcriptional regulator